MIIIKIMSYQFVYLYIQVICLVLVANLSGYYRVFYNSAYLYKHFVEIIFNFLSFRKTVANSKILARQINEAAKTNKITNERTNKESFYHSSSIRDEKRPQKQSKKKLIVVFKNNVFFKQGFF